MSHAERSQVKGRASNKASKPSKASAKQAPAKTKEQLEEEEYQAELKKEEEEAKAELKKKEIAAMNGAGTAIKKHGEEKEKVTEKEVAVDASVLAQEATKLAADASQVAADATIVAGEATEVTKKELITSHPDGCAVFGNFDVASEYCKDCLVQFAECATACQALTDSKKMKPAKGNKPAKEKKAGSTGPSMKGLRGNYRTHNYTLAQVGREGSFGRALAEKIVASGLTEADYIAIAKEHSANEKRFKEYHKYFIKEGFNVVLEDGKLVDKTVYTA